MKTTKKIKPEQIKKLEELLKAGQKNIWTPEKEGDTIYGYLTGKKTIKTKKGKKNIVSVLYTIDEGERERGVWGSTVIENKFKQLGIKGGELIAIRFLGKTKNYKNFEVAKI